MIRQRLITNLHEAARAPIDMPDGVSIVIEKKRGETEISFYKDGLRNAHGFLGGVWGSVSLEEPDWDCDNALSVSMSGASKGWGPLLYDVAIEYATKIAGGLIADRESVTSQAVRVWDYYLNRRSDVNHKQLDDTENTLTKDPKDNCNQGSADELGQERGISWHDKANPLSKIYTKKPARTMTKLAKLGKLIIKG